MDATYKQFSCGAVNNYFGGEVLEQFVTDEQLLLDYRATGDRELFTQLVYRYERELFSYLRRYLGNAEMAEDVFQSTFLLVHLKCDQFEEGRRFRPWLYTVATNQAIDAARRNKRHRLPSLDRGGSNSANDEVGKLVDLLVSDESEPHTKLETSERQELVKSVLQDLPEQQYSVVQLVYYQGMKYREAAEILDIPVGTIKSRLHSAIAKLSEAWEETQVN